MPWNPLLLLLLMFIGVGAILCAGAVWLMAWSLTHPPRMTDGRAAWIFKRLGPGDMGLGFEETSFAAPDENGRALRIAAWWIPSQLPTGRCAVLIHGYADAKVGAIAWAPLWHGLGFNLLVPDLRAHGESGGSVCTAGYYERRDLVQVLNQLRAERPAETSQIVLFGVSMGAAVAAAAAVLDESVAAVVMDSPYSDFRKAAMAHMDHLGLPGRFLQRLALALAQWMTRADYDAVACTASIRAMRCPLLLIEPGDDPFLAPADRAALEQAVASRPTDSGRGDIWSVDEVDHLAAMIAEPRQYQARLATFLAAAVGPPPQAPPIRTPTPS